MAYGVCKVQNTSLTLEKCTQKQTQTAHNQMRKSGHAYLIDTTEHAAVVEYYTNMLLHTYTPIQQTDSQSDTLLSQQIHWVSTRNINTWMLTTITTPKQGYRQQNHNSININFNSNINGIISKRKCKCNQKRGKTKHTHEKRAGTRRELMFSPSTHKTNEERKRDSWAQLKKTAIISGSVVCVWVYWEREKESKILFIHHS